jgi:hypothetical protein
MSKRRMIIDLIHVFEQEHQAACDALGFDPYRSDYYTAPETEKSLREQGNDAARGAIELRRMLEEHDKRVKPDDWRKKES